MANKRQLKKMIKFVAGDIAGECLFTEATFEGVDTSKIPAIIVHLAEAQDNAIEKVSVCFDKIAKDFDSNKDYRTARKVFFKKCYGTLLQQFNSEIEEAVKEMNALRPKK